MRWTLAHTASVAAMVAVSMPVAFVPTAFTEAFLTPPTTDGRIITIWAVWFTVILVGLILWTGLFQRSPKLVCEECHKKTPANKAEHTYDHCRDIPYWKCPHCGSLNIETA